MIQILFTKEETIDDNLTILFNAILAVGKTGRRKLELPLLQLATI
jgi:hypothetical protein